MARTDCPKLTQAKNLNHQRKWKDQLQDSTIPKNPSEAAVCISILLGALRKLTMLSFTPCVAHAPLLLTVRSRI